MRFGPLTIVEGLSQKLLTRWVPKWHMVFVDAVHNNFYERLARAFTPVLTGQRRVLTQCRQLALYSHASLEKGLMDCKPDLAKHFADMRRDFHVPETGGWRFSVDDDGKPLDNSYDLYASGFVIFALCHYARATGDEAARSLARSTLDFIDIKFRLPDAPGFAEALDENLQPIPKTRRQDPHMHLLEACLFAHDLWGDDAYARMADEVVGLFYNYFYNPYTNVLCEWFDANLRPDAAKGTHVQPGHYFEWIWLLKKHAAQRGDASRHDSTCQALLGFANRYGWDDVYGGIYDEIAPDGAVVTETKRIWPFTEAIKANALMLQTDENTRLALKQRMADMVDVFRDSYIQERGFWAERLNRDLSPMTDYMPGTTPYHIYFGIMETRAILRARGKSKSWFPYAFAFGYRLRRYVSLGFRRLRNAAFAPLKAGQRG
jgi:mannose/cellobiose epimerase-like protein (N-acyl-D-glucosamine 2-epimerase family)